MFRSRDIVALIFALILSQQAWNRQESISATVHLAFYQARKQTRYDPLRPAVLDVNGDGIPETLVNLVMVHEGLWKLQILDIALQRGARPGPFEAPVVLESPAIQLSDIQPKNLPMHRNAKAIKPLTMTVGHVLMGPDPRDDNNKKTTPKKQTKDGAQLTERTRKFFCGKDWHDAASKCSNPCPSGTTTACPEGEMCYADTPCEHYYDSSAGVDDSETAKDSDNFSLLADVNNVTLQYHLTPAGGLPSVVTLWSNGAVTLHSVAATRTGSDSKGNASFEVRLMWRTRILPSPKVAMDWQEQTVRFVDAVDADNGNGLVLVSGSVELVDEDEEDGDPELVPIVVAIHARTGQILWRSLLEDKETEEPMLPLQRGVFSLARRRSLIPNIHQDTQGGAGALRSSAAKQHCLHSFYRRPLLTSSSLERGGGALPFMYWTEEDAGIRTLHFDLEQPVSSDQKDNAKPSSKTKKKPAKRNRRNHLQYGKPNVVVTHDMTGLQVRSLRNGRSLCHLGLSEETVYADLNHDGTLDSIQLAMGSYTVEDMDKERSVGEDADDDYRFISQLAQRLVTNQEKSRSKKKTKPEEESTPTGSNKSASLCHLVALSGFPSKEELFSANLCGARYDATRPRQQKVEGAPPLLVEPMFGKGWDVVAALNNGMVQRIRGSSGWRQWKYEGNHHDSFPHWSDRELVQLSRVDSYNVVLGDRPILLVGEDALAILSAQRGFLLASAKFPQPSIHRPILVDFDGDGTTDILVQTKEALWGYKVIVRTGSSVFLRILVGLLLMALLLAMLRNRFGPHPGKRSTDL